MAFGLWRNGSFLRQGQYTPWRLKDLGSLSADGFSIASGVCSLHFVPFGSPSWSAGYESERKAYGCTIMGIKKGQLGMGRVDMRHGDRTINVLFGRARDGQFLVCLSGGVCPLDFHKQLSR